MGGPKSHPKRDAERVMSDVGGAAAAIAAGDQREAVLDEVDRAVSRAEEFSM